MEEARIPTAAPQAKPFVKYQPPTHFLDQDPEAQPILISSAYLLKGLQSILSIAIGVLIFYAVSTEHLILNLNSVMLLLLSGLVVLQAAGVAFTISKKLNTFNFTKKTSLISVEIILASGLVMGMVLNQTALPINNLAVTICLQLASKYIFTT